jgi:hypothetical protein
MQKYITVDGERVNLSAEQYTTYQKTAGQIYYNKLKEVISSDYYKELSDSDKVKLLEDVREYSVEYAKEKTLPEYHSDSSKLKTFMEIDGGYQFVLSEKTDIQDEFDIVGNRYSEYEKAKISTVNNIVSQFDIDTFDDELKSEFEDDGFEISSGDDDFESLVSVNDDSSFGLESSELGNTSFEDISDNGYQELEDKPIQKTFDDSLADSIVKIAELFNKNRRSQMVNKMKSFIEDHKVTPEDEE